MAYNKKNWYKANLHCHTNVSDGTLTPSEVVALYKKLGYNILAITDHDIFSNYSDEFSNDDFLLIPAIEGSIYLLENDASLPSADTNYTDIVWREDSESVCIKMHHFNAYLGTNAMQKKAKLNYLAHGYKRNAKVLLDEYDFKKEFQNEIDFYTDNGCFTSYNHPLLSNTTEIDFMDIKGLWALEVYNYTSNIGWNLGENHFMLDTLLRTGNEINALAVDDNHNKRAESDSGGGYIMINSDSLTHDEIIENLLTGNYYSTNGATIHNISIKDGQVTVECEKMKQIQIIVGDKVFDSKLYNSEEGLENATYLIKGHEKYIRIVCENMLGEKAWTNPIFI